MPLYHTDVRPGDRVMIPAIVLGVSKETPGEVQLEIPSETVRQPYRIELIGVPLEPGFTEPTQAEINQREQYEPRHR